MKKSLIVILGVIYTINIFANAGCIDTGKEIYDKELKTKCQIDSYSFAEKHSQNEWKNIDKTETMLQEIKKICKVDIELDKEALFNLYNFVYEYANDAEGGGCGF
jgi:predicted metalloprotease with PDZ domain